MRKSIYRRHNQVFLGLLRRYREQGRFRQRDLAQHLGSVQGTVSKAETGNRRLDVIELREWLLAMGVDFLEFMTELHQQLEALSLLDPWPPSSAAAIHEGTRPQSSPDNLSDGWTSSKVEQEIIGPVGREYGLQAHIDELAKLLAASVRSGLVREVADTLADLHSFQIRGRSLSQWFGRSPSELARHLTPDEAEVRRNAFELAQLLLSAWDELLTHSSGTQRAEMMEAVRRSELPLSVTASCMSYPFIEKEVVEVLAEYLRSSWDADSPR